MTAAAPGIPGVRKAAAVVLALGLCATLAACSGDGDDDGGGKGGGDPKLSVTSAYVSQPPMTDMAAGYLTVRNAGGGADELTSVTTPLASEVTLHTTKGTRMKQVSSLDVPADNRLELSSGGDHLMLTNLSHRPKVGEKVSFTLHFATSAPIEIKVPVEPTTYRPKD
ncbi:copper chaperone PCu(A)C [Streptomyces sp. NEAU-YJ-81]|uniref:copper chaperone PCu(A)C n=1 Tax=Streptomyces sp. NEAU-YJ-81 TaxID=2820288 RepID=UPI001ABCC344|nr:copper chaperone PCu(A)C [Streptomyces sp. NEAU-YJ-81]MBO3673833.1 copper chaperone PCu(A)C [Streptomyces sp. NEAU-YJ-81]